MNQNINVDLIPKFAVYGNLYFSQYDVGREAIINLVNGSTEYEIPSGATVTLVATKPSGLGFTQNCTFEGNQITVVCTAEMTDEAGHFPCEIRIANGSLLLGTANFTFNVERSPHPEGTTDGTADSVISQITVAFNYAMEQIENSGGLTPSIKNALLDCFAHVAWIDEHGQDYYDALADELFAVTGITLNSSTLLFNSLGSTQQLTASLIPSSSTATVTWSSSDSTVATVSSSGLVTSVANGSATITASVGSVSATCSVSVAVATVTSISAVLNASGHTFYVGDPVDDIKPYLTVTATYSDSTTQTVPSGSYTLSGTLSQVGANTITVSYESVTTTVSVTCAAVELSYISAVYTQSGTVYDTDTLDSLKSDLVVTAHYSDSTTSTVASADYTLSGTLTVGTSTITVTYLEKTTTFSVTVSEPEIQYLAHWYITTVNGNTDTTAYLLAVKMAELNTADRLVTYLPVGEHPLSNEKTSYSPSNYYPTPIPSGSTSISVSSTTADLQFGGCSILEWTGSNYTRVENIGTWGNSKVVDVSSYSNGSYFFVFNIKHSNGASVNDVDTSTISISIS